MSAEVFAVFEDFVAQVARERSLAVDPAFVDMQGLLHLESSPTQVAHVVVPVRVSSDHVCRQTVLAGRGEGAHVAQMDLGSRQGVGRLNVPPEWPQLVKVHLTRVALGSPILILEQ